MFSLTNWLSTKLGSAKRKPARRRQPETQRHTFRPCLEHLEHRITPAIETWTGNAGSLMTTGGNWADGTAPVAGDQLVFGNVVNKTVINNYAAGTSFQSITFNAGGYAVDGLTPTGNSIRLTAGIINTTGTNVINTPLILGASQSFTVTAGQLTLGGILSGASSAALTKLGAGTLTFSGNNSYTGATTVSAGVLQLNRTTAGNSINNTLTITNTGQVQLLNDNQIADTIVVAISNGGILNLNGKNERLAGLNLTGGNVTTGAGTLTLTGDVAANAAALTSTIAGNLALVGSRTFNVADGAQTDDLVVTAVIGASTTGGLIKAGAGQLVLDAANSYTGVTTVNAGKLEIRDDLALGAATGVAATGTVVAAGAVLQLGPNTNVGNELLTIRGTVGGSLRSVTGNTSSSWAGNITLAANGNLGVDAGVLILSGVIGGAFGLFKEGVGVIEYTGALSNTYTGSTTVKEGTLRLNKAAGKFGLAATGALIIGDGVGGPNADQVVLAATSADQIPDAKPITINSSGLLDLNGHDEKIGALTLVGGNINTNGATLTLGANVTTGAAAVSATIAGNLNLGTTARTFTVAPGSVPGNGPDLVISALITGSLGLTKAGTGKMVLSAANINYTGLTTVSAGTLEVQNNQALGTAGGTGTTVVSGATLALNGAAPLNVGETLTLNGAGVGAGGALRNQVGDNTYSGNITLATASSIGVQAATNLTITGTISGAGALTKTSPGTLILPNANTYTSTTTVSQGILNIRNNQSLGTGTNATTNGTTVAAGAQLQLENNITVGLERLTLNGTGVGGTGALVNVAGSSNTWTGLVVLATASSVGVPGAADVLTISGAISGAGKLTKLGAGTLDFTGAASNTNTGGTAVNEGALRLNKSGTATAIASALTIGDGVGTDTVTLLAANQIGNAVPVTVNTGGTLNLNNFSDTIGALNLGGGTVNTGTGTLTLGGNVTGIASAGPSTVNGNLSLGGVTRVFTVADGAANPDMIITAIISNGGVTKAGAGTLQFTNANTYAGLTTVSAGLLEIQNNLGLGTAAAGTSVAAGATLLLNNGANLNIVGEALALNGAGIGGLGALRNLAGDNTWAGNIALPTTSTVGVDLAGNDLTLSGVISGAGGLTKVGVGDLFVTGAAANSYTGVTTVNVGTLHLGKTAGLKAFGGALVIGDGIGGVNADRVILEADNQIPDTSPITINSSGLLDVSGQQEAIGALTFVGGNVDIGGGTLTLKGTVTTSALSTATSNIDNGTLDLGGVVRTFAVNNGTADPDLAITSVIDNGGLTKGGAGTLRLDSANTYAGVTTVSAGTLVAADAQALGTAAAGTAVAAGATLALQGGIAVTAEALTLAGGALHNLLNDNTWGGPVTLTANSFISAVASTTLTVSGAVNLGNKILTDRDAGTVDISGVVSGALGKITKTQTGTLILSSATGNTYTGGTTVSGGTLLVNNTTGSGLGTGAAVVQNTALLGGSGSFTGALTVNLGGTTNPGDVSGGIADLATGNATFQANSIFQVDINVTDGTPTAGVDYDQLIVNGILGLANAVLDVNVLQSSGTGSVYTIINKVSAGAIATRFLGLAEGATFTADGVQFQITYAGGNGNDVVITQTSNAAPVISGAVSGQAVNDNATISPFANVTIADADVPAQAITVVVTLNNAANGTLAAGGWVQGPAGTYTFNAADSAAATTAIRSLVFTPTENQVASGLSVTTLFTITTTDNDAPPASDTDSATSVIATSINDAPVLDNSGIPTLTAINEDNVTSAGTSVAAIIASSAGITDVDASAQEGIAIVGAAFTNGDWQFSLNGGSSWTSFSSVVPTLTDDTALLLADNANTLIRFVPNLDFNGTAGITFRAWDQTTGTNGTQGDANPNGGTTAFSTATETATITVNAVNDAPTILAPTAVGTGGTSVVFSGADLISIADVDVGASNVEVTLTVTNGTMTLSTIAGLSFSQGDGSADATMTFQGTLTAVNAALNGMVWNGIPTDLLNVIANDLGNTGSGGAQSANTNITIS